MKSVMSNKNAGPFNEPVDYIALGVPDYPTIISQPMDFGTIEKRLAGGQYSTIDRLADDCRLVFTNARTFNPPDHIVHKMAGDLAKFFEKKLEATMSKLDTRELGSNSSGANKEWARACRRILKTIQEHSEGYPFLEPVDWKRLGITEYPKIIKKPMDLARVERRLAQMHYSSSEGFVTDMNLVFDNAKQFNLDGSQIHQMAQNVQATFHAKCAELLGSSYTVPSKKSVKRKHHDESPKKQLQDDLGQLRSKELGQMVDLVKERCPQCIEHSEDDQIEIDIDGFSPEDLSFIADFVSTCVQSY